MIRDSKKGFLMIFHKASIIIVGSKVESEDGVALLSLFLYCKSKWLIEC